MSDAVVATPDEVAALKDAVGELTASSVRIITPEPDPWPQFLWRWFSRGWRPACGWALGLIALSEAFVRIWQITHGLPVSPVEWVPITAFGTALVIARSYDKREGTA